MELNEDKKESNTPELEKKETIAEKDLDNISPVSEAIDLFLHRILDIEDCGKNFVKIAAEQYNTNAENLKSELLRLQPIINSEEPLNIKIPAIKNLRKCMKEIDRHNKSSPAKTLIQSLYISLFSSFDKYIGDLLTALYKINPELYKNINREISLSEILEFDNISNIRDSILEKEIETIRRKSYLEQFNDLEKKFNITLTKFEKWSSFIESAQRRNLYTHCDGIISKQYIDSSMAAGYKFKEEPKVGERLKLSYRYFKTSCALVSEVAIMLGQTLWRKIQPKDLIQIDINLNTIIYNFLNNDQYHKSIELCKFALGLRELSSDKIKRMITINYAIALKSTGDTQASIDILNKLDWSASSYDFQLAYAVLTNNFASAKEIMLRIGKEGGLINEMSYHEWPLFKEFRESSEFIEAYESTYGYKYSQKLTILANEINADILNQCENSQVKLS